MSNLMVIFPGLGYTCDRPLLYYARKLASKAGYDTCHTVEYGHIDKTGLIGNKEKMLEVYKTIKADADKSLAEIDFSNYDKILFISKSIGTAVASSVAKELVDKGVKVPVKHILYTPLEQTFVFHPSNAIAFTGTNDPWCNTDEVISLAKKENIPIYVYEDANHSLETGDVSLDLNNLKKVMDLTQSFILT